MRLVRTPFETIRRSFQFQRGLAFDGYPLLNAYRNLTHLGETPTHHKKAT